MSLSDVKLHLVDELSVANDLMSWLGERRVDDLAVDTETTGTSPEHDKVRLVQIGDSMTGWAIPWERWGGVFEEAMRKYEGRITMHNAPFDVGMLRESCSWQTPVHRLDDTMLMAHVLDPTSLIGLKPLCSRHIDPAAAGLQTRLDQSLNEGRGRGGWTWATVPIEYEPYWTYAALDSVLTARLRNVLLPRIHETGAMRAYELEVQASLVCERMERNGITVDREYTQAALSQFRSHTQALSDWCKTHYDVRPSQNASVAQRLIEDGIPLDRTTASGAIELTKDVLGPYVGVHPLVGVVLEHRQYSKLASTYLRNFIEGTSDDDPKLHPSIKSVGARTGRMSMANPNLQNLPRKSESNPAAITVRNCLVPSEGNILLMVDYSQIELRLLAHLANDEGLRDAFRDPDVDAFTTMARELFNDPNLSRHDERRSSTKNAAYALSYGAGADKFAKTAGLSPEQGHDMYNRIALRFPGMRSLGKSVEKAARSRLETEGIAYVRSPLTGRRHPADDDDKLWALVNYLIQGTAAEVLKTKLIELDAAGFGPYLALPVHDEVVFDVPKDQINKFARSATSVMSDEVMFSVPLTTDASIGDRWGEKIAWVP